MRNFGIWLLAIVATSMLGTLYVWDSFWIVDDNQSILSHGQESTLRRPTNKTLDSDSPKESLWSMLKATQQEMRQTHSYCLLWCDANDLIFRNSSRLMDLYSTSEDRDVFQEPLTEAVSTKCCYVASQDSLTVLYDSRNPNVLDDEVTLVTFGTYNRVGALDETLRRWRGPVVLVLYVQDHNDLLYATEDNAKGLLTSQEQIQHVRDFLGQSKPENLAVILFLERYEDLKDALRIGVNADYYSIETRLPAVQVEPKILTREEALVQKFELVTDFPVSALRNAAQDFAETRFLIALDIDFIPDSGAYLYLKSQTSFVGGKDKTGIVLPHFERRRCSWINREYTYPENFESLEEQWDAGLIKPFCAEVHHWVRKYPEVFSWPSQVNNTDCFINRTGPILSTRQIPFFPEGVSLSDYPRWFQAGRNSSIAALYPIPSKSDQDIAAYEPYVLLDRVANASHLLMRYNELFVGRFRDKASWIFHLRLTGYEFHVATRHFLIHKDHESSPWVTPVKRDEAHHIRWKMEKLADVSILHLKNLSYSSP
eukprot:TRINITY_DN2621_c0_g1_i1.p1 TRINITY_DN2621_c0_g1~~TRINITY_DN2621_c0_g1_i1.p1  ORF type:complete len:540 (+),score=93.26 TRINITY_DN2621_c0_g1_i1:57-1676(+)